MKVNFDRLCILTEEEKRDLFMAVLTWASPNISTIDKIADDVDAYLDYVLLMRKTKGGLYGNDFYLDEREVLRGMEKVYSNAKKVNEGQDETRPPGV